MPSFQQGFQQVIIMGHMGRDPEIRYAPSGDAIANFSVATSEKWKSKDGSPQEETEWHRVVVFGKQVEAYIAPYLHKGDAVIVRGKLKTRSWEKDGVTRYSTEIVADRFGGVQGLGGKSANGRAEGVQSEPSAHGGEAAAETRTQAQDFDDDIPF